VRSCPSISDAWGRLNVVTRFIIYRGTATFTARSMQGPLRHLVKNPPTRSRDEALLESSKKSSIE
jgi:hypothetical protein